MQDKQDNKINLRINKKTLPKFSFSYKTKTIGVKTCVCYKTIRSFGFRREKVSMQFSLPYYDEEKMLVKQFKSIRIL